MPAMRMSEMSRSTASERMTLNASSPFEAVKTS
ncbi:MAG: hypothetical protein BWX71_02449 [Deltaproteobacteria bacterium ADurb.Bin072]|nr:MAG: hypothetical protein BWX71_02449 [Deltaproteobacteria bacterium ADurb.Bin072]